MSRIYQGGQSQNSYQARNRREDYNPTQELSNQQAIIQEGEGRMRDLKTQEREQQRKDVMSNATREAEDRASLSTLEMEQMQAQNLLKQQQIVENAELQTAELAAQNKLSMSNTTERGKLSVEQLSDKNVLKLNQFREASTFKLAQMVEQNNLSIDQQLDRGNLSLNQSAEKGLLALSQRSDNNKLKLSQLTANQNLQAEKAFGDYTLKQEQAVDKFLLQKSQTLENNQLKQSQALDRYSLKGDQTLANNTLAQSQSLARGSLQIDHLIDNNALKLAQSSEAMGLRYVQGADQQALKLAQSEANFALGAEQRGQQADMQLASQHLSLSQQAARSNTQQISSAISSLVSFSGTVVNEVQKNQAIAAKEQAGRDAFDSLLHDPIINSSGSVNSVVTNEANLRKVEIAEELAIKQLAPGDTVTQESIRQPGADQSMMRAESQSYVAGSALNLGARLDDLIASNPMVMNGQGQQVPLNSLRTQASYASGVKQLVRGLYEADGISKGDSYAAYTTWGSAARGAYNQAVQNNWPSIANRIKGERYDSGLAISSSLAMNGQAQAGWNAAITNSVSSGRFDSKTFRETNTQTLKDHISRLPKERIKDLLNVRKIGDQPGTEFGNSPEYRKVIMDAYNGRLRDENGYFTTQESTNTIEVKKITQGVNMALMADGLDGEQSLAIRQEAIGRLQEINTPQALDAAQSLREKGGNNQSVYLGFVEGFEGGYPPTSAELAAAREDDSISHEQLQGLKTMGLRSDQISQAISKAGLQPVRDQVKDAVIQRLGALQVPSEDRALLADQLTAYLAPQAEARLNAFINQAEPPNSLQIQQEAAKIMNDLGQEVYNPASKDNQHPLLNKAAGTSFYSLNIDSKNVVPSVNRATGKYNRQFIQTKPSDIPTNASINDAYLNRDDFLKGVELWDKGRPATEYPQRIQQVAKRLGVSPTAFIRSQAQALGYGTIDKIAPIYSSTPPTNMKSGFNALQSMGFPTRGAAYLSGNIMQESSWNGARSWGEVANDGSDRNGGLVSWMDGVAHNNFRLSKIEDYLGKGIAQASPAEQLQAMEWEMKQDYPNAYRTFMNPNATDVQLRRASREYWGYGHEGERYSYAQSLLR